MAGEVDRIADGGDPLATDGAHAAPTTSPQWMPMPVPKLRPALPCTHG
jgi:hypothetical protein